MEFILDMWVSNRKIITAVGLILLASIVLIVAFVVSIICDKEPLTQVFRSMRSKKRALIVEKLAFTLIVLWIFFNMFIPVTSDLITVFTTPVVEAEVVVTRGDTTGKPGPELRKILVADLDTGKEFRIRFIEDRIEEGERLIIQYVPGCEWAIPIS